jgi:predicted phosphodiesterase
MESSRRNSSAYEAWLDEEIELLSEYRPIMELRDLHAKFLEKGFERSKKAIARKAEKLGVRYDPEAAEAYEGELAISRGVLDDTDDDEVEDIIQPTRASYQETWEKIEIIKEEYQERIFRSNRGIIVRPTRKILSISDFHIPFDRDDLIARIIELHSDADILVINGDMLELYAVSTWPKERRVPLEHEYEIALEYLRIFSSIFPYVILTRGNHEFRLNRYFSTHVTGAISFMVDKDVLSHLANGEVWKNGRLVDKLDFSNVYYDSSSQEAWEIKIGKTIFMHPKNWSQVEAKIAVKGGEYWEQRDNSIDCVVAAHTHKQGKVISKGKLCIEQGCLCAPLDYAKSGSLNFKPQDLGYAVIYQDSEGNCDFNQSGFVFMGNEYPVNKTFEELLEDARNR